MRSFGLSGGLSLIAGAKFKSQIDWEKSSRLLTHARQTCVILRSGCATKKSHLHLGKFEILSQNVTLQVHESRNRKWSVRVWGDCNSFGFNGAVILDRVYWNLWLFNYWVHFAKTFGILIIVLGVFEKYIWVTEKLCVKIWGFPPDQKIADIVNVVIARLLRVR